ncbi:hypothetical protein [Sinimarinibacterium sp. NLF-5-8]|uniref:hypothetical protein n=1 Tax=Sinimarinibacterium sp. NLF-5-8 TaxID=2698684 RepID=UPI00137BE736|nr:hypothetical protein [Sinimarinibacterium sp. NLF-5-8]QHS09886.1 hypothetical protein GT972_06800 [Sinimarinibacterium sp. NLF-5-8]
MHIHLLLATLAALLSGPLWYAAARHRPALLSFLDGFVLVSISGLVLIEVLPEASTSGGLWTLVFVVLGLFGPTLLEQRLAHARREAHLLALGLAILGLVLHSLGDGAALSAEGAQLMHATHHHAHEALGLAIAIHSIPVGLVVWWLLFPVFGYGLPLLALLAMCAGTVGGYLGGASLAGLLGAQGWAWFQALIAGSILHVIFGRPHLDEATTQEHSLPPYEGLGNLAALGLLAWMMLAHPSPLATAEAPWLTVFGLAAPWLLLAHVLWGAVAGIRAPGAPWRAALQQAFVRSVDLSAVWVLLGGAGLTLLREWNVLTLPLPPTGSLHHAALGLLALLYAGALMRRGGRAWIADVLPQRAHHH